MQNNKERLTYKIVNSIIRLPINYIIIGYNLAFFFSIKIQNLKYTQLCFNNQ